MHVINDLGKYRRRSVRGLIKVSELAAYTPDKGNGVAVWPYTKYGVGYTKELLELIKCIQKLDYSYTFIPSSISRIRKPVIPTSPTSPECVRIGEDNLTSEMPDVHTAVSVCVPGSEFAVCTLVHSCISRYDPNNNRRVYSASDGTFSLTSPRLCSGRTGQGATTSSKHMSSIIRTFKKICAPLSRHELTSFKVKELKTVAAGRMHNSTSLKRETAMRKAWDNLAHRHLLEPNLLHILRTGSLPTEFENKIREYSKLKEEHTKELHRERNTVAVHVVENDNEIAVHYSNAGTDAIKFYKDVQHLPENLRTAMYRLQMLDINDYVLGLGVRVDAGYVVLMQKEELPDGDQQT